MISLFAALAFVPGTAQASPTQVAALRTVAIANDAGVAEAPTPDGSPSTTRVTIEVASDPAPTTIANEPAAAPEPAPEPAPAPVYRGPTRAELLAEQARDDRKTGRSLVAGGVTVAATAYLFTSLAGALAIDRARDFTDDPLTVGDESRRGERRRAFGRALLIPGVGPALAIHRADSAVRAWGAGVAGLTQAVGVGLALLGTHRLARARRLERMSVSAMASGSEAQLSLRVRF